MKVAISNEKPVPSLRTRLALSTATRKGCNLKREACSLATAERADAPPAQLERCNLKREACSLATMAIMPTSRGVWALQSQTRSLFPRYLVRLRLVVRRCRVAISNEKPVPSLLGSDGVLWLWDVLLQSQTRSLFPRYYPRRSLLRRWK